MVSVRYKTCATFLFLTVFIVTILLLSNSFVNNVTVGEDIKKPSTNETVKPIGCTKFLQYLSSKSLYGIIIDTEFLDSCQRNGTYLSSGLKIAVSIESYIHQLSIADENSTVQIIPYTDDPVKDYWTFYESGTARSVPKLLRKKKFSFEIPANVTLFMQYWSRSKMLKCENIDMKRNDTSRNLPIPSSFQEMALLRDLLVSYGMVPYLQGGSLLGWYRECSIIPHTADIDFLVFIEQLNPQFETDVLAEKTGFKFARRLAMVNDSYEYTLTPRNGPQIAIDIFFMYREGKQYWIGGTGGNGEKYRYYYPSFSPNCSADLGGHLFWVTCDPDEMLKVDYGENWRMDHPTSQFSWNSSGKNVKHVGQWPAESLKDVLRYGNN